MKYNCVLFFRDFQAQIHTKQAMRFGVVVALLLVVLAELAIAQIPQVGSGFLFLCLL
jgi:hypothetical protein